MTWLTIVIKRLMELNQVDIVTGNPPFVGRPKRKRKGYYYTPKTLFKKVTP